ncbi:MAG: hypothetical protein M5R40_20585 [Anaerolineae bacterium]|nr:hypothetical protein [Anaerolineae bacterium]
MTGLHIGGSDEGIPDCGIDNTVIRNPFNNEPYIPGSSLRGKNAVELEKLLGLAPTFSIGRHSQHPHSARTKPPTLSAVCAASLVFPELCRVSKPRQK